MEAPPLRNDDQSVMSTAIPQAPVPTTSSSATCPGSPVVAMVAERTGLCAVKAATPQQLIQLTVNSFNWRGELIGDTELPRVMFLMHKWFMSSDELANSLTELYQNCDTSIVCHMHRCSHLPTADRCPQQKMKSSICHAIRYWITTYPMQFDMDSKLRAAVQNLHSLLQSEGNLHLLNIIDLSTVPSYDWMRNMSVRNPASKPHREVSLVFDKIAPVELAEQLTYLEHKAFRRISMMKVAHGTYYFNKFSDYKHYTRQGTLKDNPKLERSIALFNGLSQWIQCMVLSKTTPQERSNVMNKFVNVAKRLYELQNFNTLMAVVGGLTHSCLGRLSKTNCCLSSDSQRVLTEYTELLSSSNNFSNYRRRLQASQGFKIPILGVHLKDLISLHCALPDKVDSDLVNFRKMAQLSVILEDLTRLHKETVPIEVNIDLINTIKLSLDLHYTEDEIYELSLAREPRNSLTSPSTPTKPLVFADWVAGVSPPDTTIINKHVNDMVEAVFKVYDHDKDGFISHAEFDAIAGNFPFIDSFCVLDADQDGMISKQEMKTYFIRANCHALRNSFKHDFHETTYFKPTFCIHCTGLLWGLIKQGWKCRDCGTNAHKTCKDLVVMECRPKCNKRGDFLTNGSECDSNSISYSTKRKMSQRQRLRSNRTAHQSTQTDDITNLSNSVCSESTTTMSSLSCDLTDDQVFLQDRLSISDEAREKLIEENMRLRHQLERKEEKIARLKTHLGHIRKYTIDLILSQIDSLHVQRDTDV